MHCRARRNLGLPPGPAEFKSGASDQWSVISETFRELITDYYPLATVLEEQIMKVHG